MDFTVIPRSVKKLLDDAGCPLTEDQYLIAAGALAAQQKMIEQYGLNKTIYLLTAMRDA